MEWWGYLFWAWVIVSLVIFVMRRVRARRNAALTLGDGDTSTGPPHPRALAHDRPAVDPAEKVWPAPPRPEPGDTTFRLTDQSPPEETAAVDAGSNETDRPPLGDPATGASTLPELLAGITLPHELVPLTQIDDALIDLSTHVIVATERANAEVVRAGMAEELERLGYDVEQVSVTHLVATGPRGRVLVDIHPDGPNATEGGVARFPTAPERSVVVELRVG